MRPTRFLLPALAALLLAAALPTASALPLRLPEVKLGVPDGDTGLSLGNCAGTFTDPSAFCGAYITSGSEDHRYRVGASIEGKLEECVEGVCTPWIPVIFCVAAGVGAVCTPFPA